MDVILILHEPKVPGNVGASARAIKTMGFNKLRLVNPCDYLSIESKMLAHASIEILQEAEVFENLSDALEGIDLSIATTAKNRDARVEFHLNTDLPAIIRSKGKSVETIGMVFGGEESGLSNDEIRMCDLASTIPLIQTYPSLNLSQAVMIFAYTLAELHSVEDSGRVSPVRENEFKVMMDKSKVLLEKLEIEKTPALYNRILERMALLGEEDIHLILSVLGRLK
ncbi:MAG TPA: RNA methyltransferase [Bacteroides sp.]|nr:RNA methyltransferase [Bacteroides sp.]